MIRLRTPRLVVLAAATALIGLAGCSSTPKAKSAGEERTASRADKPKAAEKPEPPVPDGSVSRKRLDAVLKEGPPWLLARIQIEEVLRKNKFVGWRITQFPSEWDRAGLKPGDVVTQVNGVGLERPDDFWDAWVAVSGAKEIKVAYERDGKANEAVVPIVGDVDPEIKKQLEEGTAPPPPSAKKDKLSLRKTTVVISEEANQPSEDE